jgi:GT2 family glycosyltransferase
MRPPVTIITPSFNQGHFIEQTIRSVLNQGYEPLEHLVYDGGSTDGTQEILKRYQDRLRVVVGPDGGQADAVRQGMKAAHGEFVGWLNSDDIYLPGAIDKAVSSLRAHPEASAVFGAGHYVDAAGNFLAPYPTSGDTPLRFGCFVCQPSVFMRRSALEAVDYVDASLRFCMDYDLWLRLAANAPLLHIPQPLSCYRLHPASKSVAQQLDARREAVEMTKRRMGATPLTLLYGYADLLIQSRFRGFMNEGVTTTPIHRLAVAIVTAAMALRYHRRITPEDLRLLQARVRSPEALGPSNLPTYKVDAR